MTSLPIAINVTFSLGKRLAESDKESNITLLLITWAKLISKIDWRKRKVILKSEFIDTLCESNIVFEEHILSENIH